MKERITHIILGILIASLLVFAGCTRPSGQTDQPAEEPVVLEEGSTSEDVGYYIDEEGRLIYTDRRDVAGEDLENAEGIVLPPVFPGAQRIHPAGEDPTLRKSYITRAPFEAVDQFYTEFLTYGDAGADAETSDEEIFVNSITSVDEDRRQTTLFVNESDGPRGGLKVILKEFPSQHAVQIVLTTLFATPTGLQPVGSYVTPEEVAQWAEEADSATDESATGDETAQDSEEGEAGE